MPIYLNNNKVKDLYVGNTKIGWSFLNGKLVYTNQIKTFNAGSNLVQYKVPNGVNKLRIDCVASKGKDGAGLGGNGGRVQCDLSVSPLETIYITVGKTPSTNTWTAEYNASDIRVGGTALADRIIIAGGGGSGSNSQALNGGAGGGLTGGNGATGGQSTTPTGGSQSSGGNGGVWTASGSVWRSDGSNGTLGLGGNGGNARDYVMGGAGGAGYYGGGGGGAFHWSNGNCTGGGGGGSSYTNSSCSNVVHTQGYMNGNGYIKITPIN